MKIRIDRLALAVFMAASIIFFAWLFISWIEVACKNITPNPTYNNWNAIIMFCKYLETL